MAFCDAVGRGMNSLIDAGSLLQKNALPAVLFPVRAVLASTIVFGPLILLVALAYGPAQRFPLAMLSLVPLLGLQLILCAVLGYLLAIFAAALRDTVQIVGFLFSVGIFMSPVLFPIGMFPAQWRWVLWLNPMTPIVSAYQSVLLEGAWPSLASWLVPLAWIAASALMLNVLVRRSRDELVDWL
jgi:lipopolysaccharide transport system permease protein